MTQKDIRDIAAYLYAGCICTRKTEFGTIEREETSVVEFLQFALPNGLEIVNDSISNFSLQLRPITSLTNEEKGQCASVAGYSASDIDSLTDLNGELWYWGTYGVKPIKKAAAINAYLQSIGVYVPGTIDEQYVEVIR